MNASYEGIDTVVLYDELAYEDVLPVAWRATVEPLDSIAINALTDRNIKLLQACAAIEEHGTLEKPDENAPHAADLMRMEIKVNLLLDLVGQLVSASQPRPKPVSIRFNALGAIWRAPAPHPQLGTQGLLEVYLRDALPQPLSLVARIASVTPDGQVRARLPASRRAHRRPHRKARFPSPSAPGCWRSPSASHLKPDAVHEADFPATTLRHTPCDVRPPTMRRHGETRERCIVSPRTGPNTR